MFAGEIGGNAIFICAIFHSERELYYPRWMYYELGNFLVAHMSTVGCETRDE